MTDSKLHSNWHNMYLNKLALSPIYSDGNSSFIQLQTAHCGSNSGSLLSCLFYRGEFELTFIYFILYSF